MGSSTATRIIPETDGTSRQHAVWRTIPAQASSGIHPQSCRLLPLGAVKPKTPRLSVFPEYATVFSMLIFGNFHLWKQLARCCFLFRREKKKTFLFIINHTVMIHPRHLRGKKGNLQAGVHICIGFPGGATVKNPPANLGEIGDIGSMPGLGRFPGRRKWQPTPVFLPGKPHGQRSLAGSSSWGRKESDTTEETTSLHPLAS